MYLLVITVERNFFAVRTFFFVKINSLKIVIRKMIWRFPK